jgi:regulator of replication initiation timing
MVKDGLKNEELISEILTNGSSAIDTRNEFGVHIFEGSDLDDGVVYGRLSRPKYNISELEKSVNVKITELLPPPQRVERQTVPIEVYNAATQSIVDRDTQIVGLNGTVSNLQSEVASLQSEVQALDIEIDGVKNLQGIAQNQAQVANQRTISSISQLQFSIQKATQEAIQRASLQARNDTLLTENALLREQLFGKTAQLQAGAKSSGTLFTVNAQPQINPAEAPIRASQRFKDNRGRAEGKDNLQIIFINGSQLTIFNSDLNTITITITKSTSDNARWFNIPTPTSFDLEAGKTKVISLTTTKNWTTSEKDIEYIADITISGRLKSGGPTETVKLGTAIKRIRN